MLSTLLLFKARPQPHSPVGLPACRDITCIARDSPEDAAQARRGTALHPVALQHGDILVPHVLWDDQVHQVSLVKLRDLGEPQLLQQHLLELFLGEGTDCGGQAERAEHLGKARLHPPPAAAPQGRAGMSLGLRSARRLLGQDRGFIASLVPLAQQIPQVGMKQRT